MPWWGWIVIAALLLSSEMFIQTDFYLVFFGIGALIVGLLELVGLDLPVWAQWLAFAALSILTTVFFRNRLRHLFARSSGAFPHDDVVGAIVILSESIEAGGVGSGSLRGTSWQIQNVGPDALDRGERCVVERVEGLTLHVRRATGRDDSGNV